MTAAAALNTMSLRDASPTRNASVTTLRPRPRATQRIKGGQTLYAAGDAFRMLYVVRVGVMKSFSVSDEGLMQVTGFHLPGDVVGFDGIDSGTHQGSVTALDDCQVFALPFAQCELWTQESIDAQRLMMRALACEILRGQELMLLLGTMTADQRVATFLLDLSHRYAQRGYSRSEFMLRMTRQEIGSYLGLKLETVSRALSRFHAEGIITVSGKSVGIIDFAALWKIAGLSPDHRWPSCASILDSAGELRRA
ncbi:MAG TPA: helix-turn-helix domain-containing protein [Burkholderiales bacterium]|nr:helix-turn-helix domain-containing protein [Burkholderiales bacterium]